MLLQNFISHQDFNHCMTNDSFILHFSIMNAKYVNTYGNSYSFFTGRFKLILDEEPELDKSKRVRDLEMKSMKGKIVS